MSLEDKLKALRESQEAPVEETVEVPKINTPSLEEKLKILKPSTKTEIEAPTEERLAEKREEVFAKVTTPSKDTDTWIGTAWNYASNPGEFDVKDLVEGTRSVGRNVALIRPLLQLGVATKARRNHQRRMLEIHGPDFDMSTDANAAKYDRDVAMTQQKVKSRLAIAWLKDNPRTKEGWIGDLMRMGPQFAAQILTTIATGPAGGMAFMGAQIFSDTAIQAIEAGSDPERAIMAGAANAIIAAPMEQLGIGKLSKYLPLKKGIIGKFRTIFGAQTREALTEILQQIPDHAMNIFAKDPDLGMLQALDKTLSDPVEVAKLKKEIVAAGFGGFAMGTGAGFMQTVRRNTEIQQEKEVVEDDKKKPKKPKTKAKKPTISDKEKLKLQEKKKKSVKKAEKAQKVITTKTKQVLDLFDIKKPTKTVKKKVAKIIESDIDTKEKTKQINDIFGIKKAEAVIMEKELADEAKAIEEFEKAQKKTISPKVGKEPNYFEFSDGKKIRGTDSGDIYNKATKAQKKEMDAGIAKEGFTDEAGEDIARKAEKAFGIEKKKVTPEKKKLTKKEQAELDYTGPQPKVIVHKTNKGNFKAFHENEPVKGVFKTKEEAIKAGQEEAVKIIKKKVADANVDIDINPFKGKPKAQDKIKWTWNKLRKPALRLSDGTVIFTKKKIVEFTSAHRTAAPQAVKEYNAALRTLREQARKANLDVEDSKTGWQVGDDYLDNSTVLKSKKGKEAISKEVVGAKGQKMTIAEKKTQELIGKSQDALNKLAEKQRTAARVAAKKIIAAANKSSLFAGAPGKALSRKIQATTNKAAWSLKKLGGMASTADVKEMKQVGTAAIIEDMIKKGATRIVAGANVGKDIMSEGTAVMTAKNAIIKFNKLQIGGGLYKYPEQVTRVLKSGERIGKTAIPVETLPAKGAGKVTKPTETTVTSLEELGTAIAETPAFKKAMADRKKASEDIEKGFEMYGEEKGEGEEAPRKGGESEFEKKKAPFLTPEAQVAEIKAKSGEVKTFKGEELKAKIAQIEAEKLIAAKTEATRVQKLKALAAKKRETKPSETKARKRSIGGREGISGVAEARKIEAIQTTREAPATRAARKIAHEIAGEEEFAKESGVEQGVRNYLDDSGQTTLLSVIPNGTKGVAKFAKKEIYDRVADWFDVEAQWKRIGANRIGRTLKTFFSVRTIHEDNAKAIARTYVKTMRKAFGRKDFKEAMADSMLLAENFEKNSKGMDLEYIEKLKPGVQIIRDFFDNALVEYENRGVTGINFVENARKRINKKIDQAETLEEVGKLYKIMEELETQSFTHIPTALWFPEMMTKKASKSRKAQKRARQKATYDILVKKRKRKGKLVSMSLMINKKLIKKSKLNPVEMFLSYGFQKGKDMAMLDIRDAAIKEGLAVSNAVAKTKAGKAAMRKHKKKGAQFKKISPRDYNVFKGYTMDMRIIEGLENAFDIDKIQNPYQKMVSITKMLSFYNPLFMPVYDIYQGMIMGGGILRLPQYVWNLGRGMRDVMQRNEHYKHAASRGLFSKPFNNPLHKLSDMQSSIMRTTGKGGIADFAYVAIKNLIGFGYGGQGKLNVPIIHALYNLSWNTAWKLDECVRMATYNTLRGKGLKASEAAQAAAKVHGDYAGIPARTRKIMNNVIFTPTFAVAMLKVQGRMVNELIKGVGTLGIKGPRSKTANRQLALGAAVTAAALMGIDQLLKSWGYEPEDWGVKYVKKVKTPEGEYRSVISMSSPLNKWISHYHKIMGLIAPGPEVRTLSQRLSRFKWQLTPAYRIPLDTISNRKNNGDTIWNEFDDPWEKPYKAFLYSAGEVLAMSKYLTDRKQFDNLTPKAREALDADLHNVLRWLDTYHFAFVYGKKGTGAEFSAKARKMTNTLRRDLRNKAKMKELRNNPELKAKWLQNYRRRLKELKEQK